VDVAQVVAHPRGPRREQREVGAPLALLGELGVLEAGPDLVVADDDRALGADVARVALDRGPLGGPVGTQRRRRRGVVPVAVDDHRRRSRRLSTIL
jgi:hypothetical protein